MEAARDMSDINRVIFEESYQEALDRASNGYRWLEHEGFDVIREHFVTREEAVQVPYYDEIVPLSIDGKEVWVSGTPDLVLDYAIIDWKSGKTRSKKHALQMAAYSQLLSLTRELTLPARIFYMAIPMKEKVIKKTGAIHKYHERGLSVEELSPFFNEWDESVLAYVKGVEAGLEEEPEPQDCSDCFFCPYRDMCFGVSE